MNPWSIYWRQGHSTTFGDWFSQGYDGAVADWWQAWLENSPAPLVIVELGCGNCSLLPAMVKSGASGKYIGVDMAQVSPSAVAEQGLGESGIELVVHSETPAETVPEPNDSVDIVASVFGIEYSDLERSVPEAARLLKSGGRFCGLLHHTESVVTTMSRRSLSEYDGDDLRKTIESLTAISEERDRVSSLSELKHSHKAETGRQKINSLAQKYLPETNPKTANRTMIEFMTQALKFFKMMGASGAQRHGFIESLEAEHKASHERFRQMVSVALDEAGAQTLRGQFEDAGFRDVTVDVVRTGEDILAWELQAVKNKDNGWTPLG